MKIQTISLSLIHLLSLAFCQKLQVLAEGAVLAGDLSEEVDEGQNCGVKPPGEEEGYDADSESNPEDMAKQEEGRFTHFMSLLIPLYTHLTAVLVVRCNLLLCLVICFRFIFISM